MMTIVMALGFVLVFEGLVLALAPSRFEQALRLLLAMPVETRRTLGLCAVAFGVLILWGLQLLT